MFATRHFTYKLPSITEKPKEVFALWWKFTKSAKSLGISLFAINMLGGMLLTSKEFSQYANIMKEMEEEDRRIENDLLPLDVDTDIK
jgi:transmembrane protein 126A